MIELVYDLCVLEVGSSGMYWQDCEMPFGIFKNTLYRCCSAALQGNAAVTLPRPLSSGEQAKLELTFYCMVESAIIKLELNEELATEG